MNRLAIWVPGIPVSQGSMRSPKAGVVMHSNPDLKAWRRDIAWMAKDVWRGQPLIDGPVFLDCEFFFERTKNDKGMLGFKRTAPDLDKLIRAVGDALEGVVLKNDSRIVQVVAAKCWTAHEPGVHIEVRPL